MLEVDSLCVIIKRKKRPNDKSLKFVGQNKQARRGQWPFCCFSVGFPEN